MKRAAVVFLAVMNIWLKILNWHFYHVFSPEISGIAEEKFYACFSIDQDF